MRRGFENKPDASHAQSDTAVDVLSRPVEIYLLLALFFSVSFIASGFDFIEWSPSTHTHPIHQPKEHAREASD